MADIDRLSRVVPCICKTAPNNHDYYMEDVHRAGGIFAILKELDKAGKLHTDVYTIHAPTLKDAIEKWDVTNPENTHAIERFKAAPGGVRTTQAFSQNRMWKTLDLDREKRLYPQRRTRLLARRRFGGLVRQHRRTRLRGKNRRRGREHPQIHRPRPRV